MTIRHLTVFAAVAEQGSMSAAAKHLYLSQPTVSQAVRELEAHYNGLLFERLGKKLYLTERGKLLLPHAREMIRQFQQLEELMQNQGQSSTLKLGSTLTVGTCLTPSIILDLQKKIPDLDVYSFVTNTPDSFSGSPEVFPKLSTCCMAFPDSSAPWHSSSPQKSTQFPLNFFFSS